jgi:acylphosphatase
MKQVHVFISGEVQGVGYRQFVRGLAKKYIIAGWVRNLPDGRVEAVMQGDMDKVNKILLLLKDGSFLAEVKNVDMNWEEGEEEFKDFAVR